MSSTSVTRLPSSSDDRAEVGRRGSSIALPDRPAAAGQAVFVPAARDALDDLVRHADLPPPFAPGLGRPFVGGVEADLAAETRLRAREIEIVDGRALDHGDVTGRIHARRDRPHDVLPVARVD